MTYKHIGIDYGSQNSGTTCIAFISGNERLNVVQCPRNTNADQWITEKVSKIKPSYIFLDSPLSLPKTYAGQEQTGDHFFRECDKQLKAMSPMFLGGLTARAIQLKKELESEYPVKVLETYPGYLGRMINPVHYKKKIDSLAYFFVQLKKQIPGNLIVEEPQNWHQLDAILAWLSGHRFFNDQATEYGDPEEGTIIV